jgi:hypothetical protein
MAKSSRPPARWSVVVSVGVCLAVAGWAGAQSGSVTFWNKLDGGVTSVASEIGPDLFPWDPEVDGGTGANDVAGPPRFEPGRFGNAVTLGPGGYYSMARVHGLVLRNVSSVVNAERGTVAVWYKEKERPLAFQHNLYKLFDGGFGLDCPVQLANNAEDALGNLYFAVIFGGEQNVVHAPFAPVLGAWVHVAAVWDRGGIDGTAETARLYVDGVEVGAITTRMWGSTFQGNRADIAGGGDFMEDMFVLDNLVVYDYAKTDFSDRFSESPVAPGRTLIIPTAAHLGGALGTNWRTDVEAHNPGGTPATYEIALLAHDADNNDPDTRAFTLAPGAAVRHADVLMQAFAFTGKAALRVAVTAGDVIVASRTYNRLAAGNPLGVPEGSTFGEFVPAVPSDRVITGADEGRLILLSHTDPASGTGYRTNVGVVNAGAGGIDVVVELFDAAGSLLGSVRRSLAPHGYHQFDSILGPWAGVPIDDAYAVVHSTTPGGRFIAYASVIDNRTGGPIFVPAATRPSGRTGAATVGACARARAARGGGAHRQRLAD